MSMTLKYRDRLFALMALIIACLLVALQTPAQTLPSWKDGPTKQAIIDFVQTVTTEGGAGYVPPAERIATFDNDGCLWCEQPVYFQLLFALDRVKAMADDHPEWQEQEPFKSVLANDYKAVVASGKEGLVKILMASHADMTATEFQSAVADWLKTAKHPSMNRPYTSLVYQPQLELLAYLRDNGFKTFIVSGGGIDFLRVFAEEAYGIPPEQVVGSSIQAKFEMRDGVPVIVKLPDVDLIDDKTGKPVGIHQNIGRRPIFACGNSDGDFQMLQFTTIARDASDTTPRLGVLIHHDDAGREFAYDRESHIGQLNKALDEADAHGWLVVSMKNDWATVFPEE